MFIYLQQEYINVASIARLYAGNFGYILVLSEIIPATGELRKYKLTDDQAKKLIQTLHIIALDDPSSTEE